VTDDRYPRAVAFEREILRRSSTSVEPFAFGAAYLHRDLPHRWTSNLLWLDLDARPPGASAVVAEAERILGGAGLAHRKVVANGGGGAALAAPFARLGWTVHRADVMTLERDPDRPGAVAVDRVGYEDARPLITTITRRWEVTENEEALRQLIHHKAVMEDRVGASFFVARIDGAPAGMCELYVAGDTAQIEDVNTLEEHRGRGVARSVVLSAAAAARDAGAALVFLLADQDDWPRHLYGRLGFDPVGPEWEFLRTPSEESTREPRGPRSARSSRPFGHGLPHIR
jgi:GNAT superfamily N-acetyltransferase